MSELTPIEESFKVVCDREGIAFETQEQVSRYRTDFFDKSRKLVIELDGHEHHKSKEDRTYDAKRDRQLHRDGYTVLRFTGSEIHSSLPRCIEEVKQTLQLMKAQPPKLVMRVLPSLRTEVRRCQNRSNRSPLPNSIHCFLVQNKCHLRLWRGEPHNELEVWV